MIVPFVFMLVHKSLRLIKESLLLLLGLSLNKLSKLSISFLDYSGSYDFFPSMKNLLFHLETTHDSVKLRYSFFLFLPSYEEHPSNKSFFNIDLFSLRCKSFHIVFNKLLKFDLLSPFCQGFPRIENVYRFSPRLNHFD